MNSQVKMTRAPRKGLSRKRAILHLVAVILILVITLSAVGVFYALFTGSSS